jgi:hypothetical protein
MDANKGGGGYVDGCKTKPVSSFTVRLFWCEMFGPTQNYKKYLLSGGNLPMFRRRKPSPPSASKSKPSLTPSRTPWVSNQPSIRPLSSQNNIESDKRDIRVDSNPQSLAYFPKVYLSDLLPGCVCVSPVIDVRLDEPIFMIYTMAPEPITTA